MQTRTVQLLDYNLNRYVLPRSHQFRQDMFVPLPDRLHDVKPFVCHLCDSVRGCRATSPHAYFPVVGAVATHTGEQPSSSEAGSNQCPRYILQGRPSGAIASIRPLVHRDGRESERAVGSAHKPRCLSTTGRSGCRSLVSASRLFPVLSLVRQGVDGKMISGQCSGALSVLSRRALLMGIASQSCDLSPVIEFFCVVRLLCINAEMRGSGTSEGPLCVRASPVASREFAPPGSRTRGTWRCRHTLACTLSLYTYADHLLSAST